MSSIPKAPPGPPAADRELVAGLLRLVRQDNPKVAYFVEREIKLHDEAVAAGRWVPLR